MDVPAVVLTSGFMPTPSPSPALPEKGPGGTEVS